MTSLKTLKEFENLYNLMLPAQKNSKECFAWFSGIPHPLFNTIMHFTYRDLASETLDSLILKAQDNIPISFWSHHLNTTENIRGILQEKGFTSIMVCPLMSWQVQPIESLNTDVRPAHMETFNDIS